MAKKPSTDVVVPPKTPLVSWEDKLAKYARQAVDQEASVSSGSSISFAAGQITFQGNPAKGNKLAVVVVNSILENCYYEGKYNADDPQPPVCYAFGNDDKEMAPHEDSPKPQAKTCSECEWNKFGTADDGNGKGKACKNTRRLALLPADPLSKEVLQKNEFAFAKLPVTSVKGWASYVRTLAGLEKRPPMGVVTEISTVPDTKTQFKVVFAHKSNLNNEMLDSVEARVEEAGEALILPYPEPTTPAKPVAGKKKKY